MSLIPEIRLPTSEEMAASRQRMITQAQNNPTCFTHWFESVQACGIPHPASTVIPFSLDLQESLVNGTPDAALLTPVITAIREAGEAYGYPLFIKNSLFSGKHFWKHTCYLHEGIRDDEIIEHLTALTEFWLMGCSDMALYLVVREMLPTAPIFHAHEAMPVTAEFRFFADNGRVEGFQPYWPEHSVENPSVVDWRERLKTIQRPSDADLNRLTRWAEQITEHLGGAWSVDFLQDHQGQYYLIDMAEAYKSYRNDAEFCPL